MTALVECGLALVDDRMGVAVRVDKARLIPEHADDAARLVEKEKHIDQLDIEAVLATRNIFFSTRRACGSTRISIRSSGYSA